MPEGSASSILREICSVREFCFALLYRKTHAVSHHPMNKTCLILGSIAGAVVLGLVILAFVFLPGLFKLNNEATVFIQDVVPKIAAHWDSKELTSRATLELISSGKTDDAMERYFVMFRRLGALKHLDTPKGGVQTFTNGSGTTTTGRYSVGADFEHGPATIYIELRRMNNTWQINGFRIDSNAMLPPKQEVPAKEASPKDAK
jgi:hypothetical protein